MNGAIRKAKGQRVTLNELHVRPVKDADADGLIKLVEGCFREYPDCHIDLDDLDTDLLAWETYLRAKDGEGFVVEEQGRVVASVGYVPLGPEVFEIRRLYVDAALRGSGIAQALIQLVENRIKTRGGVTAECWSDTRFERAHRFYEREGYARQPETRDLNDISNTPEYQFRKTL